MKAQPPNLETIERWMQSVIMHPGGVLAGLVSAESQQHIEISTDDIEQVVTRSRTLTPIRRLGIYSHAYFARLQECLRAEFPVLLHALGEELFNLFTFDYLQHYPPRSYTLNRLGENLPRHLAETRPNAEAPEGTRESWPDFIIDLATLERAFSEIFDGPGVEDRQILNADYLLEMDQLREVRFLPVVCLRLFSFRYPVSQYFRAVRNQEDPPLPQPDDTFLAMTRRSYTVFIHELTGRQYDLLVALVGGQTLNQGLRDLAKATGDDFQTLINASLDWIKDWADKGFFAGIESQVGESSGKPIIVQDIAMPFPISAHGRNGEC
jgi:Putative DNA-binding domain